MLALKQKQERENIGSAVRNGQLRFTSASQIKLFDPKSDGCNRKWAFQYLLRKKPKKTPAQEHGTNYAAELEHYLTTGEDVLSPTLQPAKKYFPLPGPDLECERPLGDIAKSVALRDALLKLPRMQWPQMMVDAMKRFAGLTAHDVPIEGAADYRHRRGEFVGPDGQLRRETPGAIVVEIGDLKTISRIYPQKILSGENAGIVLQSYAKSDAEICDDIQMLSYGRHGVDLYRDITHTRLSHVYANTKKKEAVKRTGIISVETLLRRWERVDQIVAQMEQVATATKIEDIEPNLNACDAFTHVDPDDPESKRVLKGCAHRYYCPLAAAQVAPTLLGPVKEAAMSLFDQGSLFSVPAPVPPPVPVPIPASEDFNAAVQREKERLLAEESFGFCTRCGGQLSALNMSKLPSGEVKHIGCPRAAVTAPPLPIAINPPDRPPPAPLLEAADPVPPEAIAEITDPALKQTVEEHARQHAERAAAEARKAEEEKLAAGSAIWCQGSSQRVVITTEMTLGRGYVCKCGKTYSAKTLKPLLENGQHVAVIPKHKPPKKEDAHSPAQATLPLIPPAPPVAATEIPPSPPVATTVVPPPPLVIDQTVVSPIVEQHATTNGHTNGHTNGTVSVAAHLLEGVEMFRVETEEGRLLSIAAPNIVDAISIAQKVAGIVVAAERWPGDIMVAR